MTRFEEKLKQTETLDEALNVQACPEDGLTELEVEKLRLAFLEEWFNISVYEYAFLMNARRRAAN